jgi:hypothetical protein
MFDRLTEKDYRALLVGAKMRYRDNSEMTEALDTAITLFDAKAEGRLVVLPCKVGDVVWKIKAVFSYFSKPMEDRVERIIISSNEILVCCTSGTKFSVNSIGKTVFLTREEAEKALQEGLK